MYFFFYNTTYDIKRYPWSATFHQAFLQWMLYLNVAFEQGSVNDLAQLSFGFYGRVPLYNG